MTTEVATRMINSVAIQRLLEAAIMLKLERSIGVAGAQDVQAKVGANTSPAPKHPAHKGAQQPAQSQPFQQRHTWNNPLIVSMDGTTNIATALAPTAPRETALAPLAYRESLTEMALPARSELPPLMGAAVPSPIQYANAELAHALSAKAPNVLMGMNSTTAFRTGADVADLKSSRERATQRRMILVGAIGGGSAILVAALCFAYLK